MNEFKVLNLSEAELVVQLATLDKDGWEVVGFSPGTAFQTYSALLKRKAKAPKK